MNSFTFLVKLMFNSCLKRLDEKRPGHDDFSTEASRVSTLELLFRNNVSVNQASKLLKIMRFYNATQLALAAALRF